ncbi:MAG: AMP-dependent synthetase/ligase [Betaproteobacteria bacterium]
MPTHTGRISYDEAITLDGLFRARASHSAGRPAYVDFNPNTGRWRTRTWGEMYTAIGRWQAGFAQEGFAPGERVALMQRNSPEWVMFDQAAYGEGLVVVPLYTVDRPENVAYILGDCGAKLVLFDTQEQWEQFRVLGITLPGVERILVLNPSGAPFGDARVRSVGEWLPQEGVNRHVSADPKKLASIIYTSGTTGRPKGVMLTHDNLLSNCRDSLENADVVEDDEFLSFLPLSHVFERNVGYYMGIMVGFKTTYARSIAQLGEDLQIVRPTIFHAVPRIFERVWAAVKARLDEAPERRRRLFYRTVDIGYARFEHAQGRGPWKASFLLWPVLERLVARKVMVKLGGRLRSAGSGGAALAPEISRIFIGLGLPVIQGYGMTEASPVITTNTEKDNVPGSVGRVIPNVEIRVAANGELLVRGPNVMMGYWNNPQATAAALADGWLHTGDVARIDEGGHVYITGRIKDIIVLANGEKMPPGDIEEAITGDSLFEQALVLGEGRSYLAALVVVNPALWTDAARAAGIDPEVLASPGAERIVLERIGARMRTFPGYAQIRRAAVSGEPWSVENGLLTPTLKARRAEIVARHATAVARLYEFH